MFVRQVNRTSTREDPMDGSESRSGLVLELAEEFLERYRDGQRPALKEYTDRYP